MLLIYAHKNTPRLAYIIDTLCAALGLHYRFTTNVVEFNAFSGARLEYTDHQLSDGVLHMTPAALLFENNIRPQLTEVFTWRSLPAFYKTENETIPFDLFAASFYLLSRYEEYLAYQPDLYQRYGHQNSMAYRENFLHMPLINLWLQEFKMLMVAAFPALNFTCQPFIFLPTYDIDMAWNYKSKGVVRNGGGLLQSVCKGQWIMAKERLKVLMGQQKDPFDLYDWLNALHKKHRLTPHYFVLVAKKRTKLDKNIWPGNRAFINLIKKIAAADLLGLHPSWKSGDAPLLLSKEKRTLAKLAEKTITASRQHYIRMRLPDTYRQLAAIEIKKEYSMGYGSINGFRASYCLPFFWYDLQKNQATKLLIHPFCWMEANSHYEQHYSLQQAKEELEYYFEITRLVNGMLITICHNHILGNKYLFQGWAEMYAGFFEKNFAVAT